MIFLLCVNSIVVMAHLLFCRRGSVPVHSKDSNRCHFQTNKSATIGSLLAQKKLDDSEYINVETPVVLSEEGNYVNTDPVTQESSGESYVNFKPLSHQRAKHHSHDSSTEYINVDTPNEDTLRQKVPTINLPDKVQSIDKPVDTGHIISVGLEETDGEASADRNDKKPLKMAGKIHSIEPLDTTPNILPSNISKQVIHTKATDVDYENNFTPLRAPSAPGAPALTSEYVEMAAVSIGQAKGHREFVSIKTPPSITDNPLASEKTVGQCPQTELAGGYENFVPIKAQPSSTDIPEMSTISVDQCHQAELPVGGDGYEDFVPIKNPPPSSADTAEVTAIGVDQYPQTEPAAGYEDFVPIKNQPPSSADTPEVTAIDVGQYPQTEPAAGYEDFVPIKNSSSTASTQLALVSDSQKALEQLNAAERNVTEVNIDGEYSHLQFRSKESSTISEQSDSLHPSTEGSNSDSLYSKLDKSEMSKSTVYDNVASLKDKPQVPSRNLKRPVRLYELSSSFTVIPPLPPRNPSLQSDSTGSPSPPPLPPPGSKPVMTPNAPPPVGPKPGTRNNHAPPTDVKYCDLEFTDIGQPRFRPRSKVIDQVVSSQNAYAIIDRDASVGLQLTLEQKMHNRR